MQTSTRIRNIQVFPFDVPLINPFTIASTKLIDVNNFIVELELQNGIKGYGEGTILHPVTVETQTVALQIAERDKQALIDQDVSSWRHVADMITGLFSGYSVLRCAFESAMFDALTQSLRLPLYQFFGGSSSKIDTDITIPICPESQAEQLATSYRNQGFSTIKTKIGLDIDQDIARLKAIKRGFPDALLVLDANEGYSATEAM